MKSYNHLFETATSDEVLLSSLKSAIRGKRERPDVIEILGNKEKYMKKFKEWLQRGDYIPLKYKATVINDGFVLKKRIIIQPYFYPEQWVQHVVVTTLKPMFLKGMYEFSCGSIPNRGVHYGKKHLEKFIKTSSKPELKYVLKLDIHHFYQSINIELLKARFKEYIHDEKMLKLIYYVLDSNTAELDGETISGGLPIGFYTSQWFANWYLQDFDHFVKEKLKVKCYIRYMDDMVLFGRNKKELHKKLEAIREYLAELGLELKSNYQIFRFDYTDKKGNRKGRFIDFMGFKFYRDRTTIRGKIFIRALRKARRIGHKEKLTWYDASQVLSYLGWFKSTNTYKAHEKYIKPFVNIDLCKELLRRYTKRVIKKTEVKKKK